MIRKVFYDEAVTAVFLLKLFMVAERAATLLALMYKQKRKIKVHYSSLCSQ